MGSEINGQNNLDRFGFSVSLSSDGSIVASGAIYNDDGGANSGHVRVFNWDGTNWNQLGNILMVSRQMINQAIVFH